MTEKTKLPDVELSQVEIDDDGVLYIRIVPDPDRPKRHEVMKKTQNNVEEVFKAMLPDTKIVVGYSDLRFSSITKKKVFKGKLDGKI